MNEIIDVNAGYIADESCAMVYEVTENPRDFDTFRLPKEEFNHHLNQDYVADWRIYRYGYNDDIPRVIKKTVQENSSAPGMLEKKMMMVWGQGPFLYKESIENNQLVRNWSDDSEIQSWLDTWDYEQYLLKCAVDYDYIKSNFTKFHRNKGTRIGSTNRIAMLSHILADEGRLASKKSDLRGMPTHIAETDFSLNEINAILQMKVYPKFNVRDPFAYPTSAYYSNQYTFGDKFYSTSPLLGALEWLRRSTATPIIFKAMSKNSVNIKFHVESPQEFWNFEEERIKKACQAKGEIYNYNMLVAFRKKFMRDLLKVLAGDENTGKVWHTRKTIEVQGHNLIEHGWKIEPIDQKILDFVRAQIEISQRADRALSTSITMHGSISNIGESGNSDSGSEQLYAYQNFINSSVDIPEMVICASMNMAIKANFPNKNLKMGFMQRITQKQQDVTPGKRVKNIEEL
jgi:hypothetical protein